MYSNRLTPTNQLPSHFYINDSNMMNHTHAANANLINQAYMQQRSTHPQSSSIQATPPPPPTTSQNIVYPKNFAAPLPQAQPKQALNRQMYQNKSLLGQPPDNQMLNQSQHQIISQNNNYHQHASSLITLTGNNSNPSGSIMINQNRQLMNVLTQTNNKRNNYSQQQSNQAKPSHVYSNNNNNKQRATVNRNRYQKTNMAHNNKNDSDIYKQNLKKSIDANRRNINQRLNLNQQAKTNFKLNNSGINNYSININQYSLVNSSTSEGLNSISTANTHHTNKQLIVIKPNDDLFDDNKNSNSKLNKRSHSNSELNKLDSNDVDSLSKKLKNQNYESMDKTNTDDKENFTKNCIIKLQGNLVEIKQQYQETKINNENNTLIQINLEVFYCKLCNLTLYDDKYVREHLNKLDHKSKLPLIDRIKSEPEIPIYDANNNKIF